MFVLPLAYALPRRAAHSFWARPAQHTLVDDSQESVRPAMDAVESDAAFTLTFDVPGLTREQVAVTVEGRDVAVEATPSAAAADSDAERTLRRERRSPRLARRVRLPVDVDAEGTQARVENGVLTLTLPKRQPSGARAIEIR